MTRDINALTIAASQAEIVKTVIICELDFVEGFVRLASSPFDITAFGSTFIGVGGLGDITAVEEKSDLSISNFQLSLSGIESSTISLALGSTYKNRNASVWLVLLDDSNAIIGDPVNIFNGYMDTMNIVSGKETRISVTVVSKLAAWNIPSGARYTDAEQQRLFPGDKGLEYIAMVEDMSIIWGRG